MTAPRNLRQGTKTLLVITFCMAGLLLGALSGCSVYKAVNQPEKKNLSVLSSGTPRMQVIAELGAPTWSEERNGEKVDLFTFKQGYSKGAKTGRALFHGAADVLTIGMWEVVGTPIETVADGTDMKVEITYDSEEKVKNVNRLQEQ
jgi:outer membrane protein assembly factor BamE (lipoprotein component of BamABCDE complex)